MKANDFKLESGQEYTLTQLFNGKNKIVIPDLQRDYCWGDKAWNKDADNYTELVSGFIDNLISSFNEEPIKNLTLGLIYGYENPHFSIQLCDGQQRLTTLFLLMGMINRKTENNYFKNILISEAELKDDKEPNLLYAIRESTLYFLSDLVCKFFLEKEIKIEEIRKQDWYFKEYDLDASIQSMLSAIKIIDIKLNNSNDYQMFGEFIINNIQMLYYDMGHRTRGEETFVVINTTGEPLTATENLKPILIGVKDDKQNRKKVSEEWETREEWFWQNKESDEQTSDEALKTFLIWYWQIHLLQEKSWKDKKPSGHDPKELFQKKPIFVESQEENPDIDKWEKGIKLEILHKYFTALQQLVDKSKEEEIERILRTIHKGDLSLSWFRSSKVSLDIVLPLIAYVEKFGTQKLYQFVRRIRRNYFDNIWKERNKNYLDWRHIVQIIEYSKSVDDVFKFETLPRQSEFKKIPNVTLNEWYNEYEKQKAKLSNDQKIEVEKWEEHQDFMGDLSFFHSTELSFVDLKNSFTNYTNIIDMIRGEENNPISNTYRLFLLYIGCEKVEHKPRVSWDIEGVLFSTISRKHLKIEKFKELCNQDSNDLENYCIDYIKNKIRDWNLFNLTEENFTTDQAIKSWLTLKVFNANKEKVCLAYYDGNNSEEGVSVYKNVSSNKLIDSEPFSIANMICGFGVKAGMYGSKIHYNTDNWLNPNIIDTPFFGIEYNKDNRNKEQIIENQKVIDDIIRIINS
jgi:hypothetical protein